MLKTEVKAVPVTPTHNLHCERFWSPYNTPDFLTYILAKRVTKGLGLNWYKSVI